MKSYRALLLAVITLAFCLPKASHSLPKASRSSGSGSGVYAATIHVPDDQPTIQAGINAAVDGDTVLVSDSTYYERISFLGKAIIVASEYLIDSNINHIANTIIDGNTTINPVVDDTGSVVRFVNGEDSTTCLVGFTIQNGTGTLGKGGGILCNRVNEEAPCPSPQIKFCNIVDNHVPGGEGGGLWKSWGEPIRVEHCVFRHNSPDGFWGAGAILQKCVFDSNSYAGVLIPFGGVIMDSCIFLHNLYGLTSSTNDVSPVLRGCTFQDNVNAVQLSYPGSGSYTKCRFIGNNKGLDLSQRPYPKDKRRQLDADRYCNYAIDSCDFMDNGLGLDVTGMGWNYCVSNCMFSDNGTALSSGDEAWINLDRCLFSGNGYGITSVEGSCHSNLTNCEFRRNTAGALHNVGYLKCEYSIFTDNTGEPLTTSNWGFQKGNAFFINCTFAGNSVDTGPLIRTYGDSLIISSCIISSNQSDEIAECLTWDQESWSWVNGTVVANCTDIVGNEAGNWSGFLAGQDTVRGNFSANPLFCDTLNSSYTLKNSSPCAPANNSCGVLIGAYGIGCENVAPVITSRDTVMAYEDTLFNYQVEFEDGDGPDTTITYLDYPSWLVVDSTGLHGIPPSGAGDSVFSVIVSDGFAADTQAVTIEFIATNDPPVLSEIDSDSVKEGGTLRLPVSATDINGDSLVLSTGNLPDHASFADSGNGHGLFAFDPDTSQAGEYPITFYVSDGTLSDTLEVLITVLSSNPTILEILVDSASVALHVTNHTPLIAWRYLDSVQALTQQQFEIAVATDSNWIDTDSLLWNPDQFVSSDTFVVYAGALLLDGETYWLRLRVSNSLAWSEWKQISFRMNSIPSVPQLLTPLDSSEVTLQQPQLTVLNSTDAESDTLLYIFEVYADSFPSVIYSFTKAHDADSQTTLIVDSTLTENAKYWWRVKASDYYDTSSYSSAWSFYVNSTNTAPTAVVLTLPADSAMLPLDSLRPIFSWTASTDDDPFDTVTYNLFIAMDSNFAFVVQVPNLTETSHTLTTDLQCGKRYWWKVKATDRHGGETSSQRVFTFCTRILGDADSDCFVNVSDAVYLIAHIFCGDPAPNPLDAGDADCNGFINITDAVYLIDYIYGGGPAPCASLP